MEAKDTFFAIFAEAEGHERPLIVTGLTFARLMDDIVVPYQQDEAFFVDGVPTKKDKLRKLKILRQHDAFEDIFLNHHFQMRKAALPMQELYADQYHIRVEGILREYCEDVTSQVVKAYDKTIKPRLSDYLPKREELIGAALKIFVEGMKALGSGG